MVILDWLKKAWAAWKKVGHFIGNVVGRVVLTILYFTVVLPFGVGVRLFGDPLAIKPKGGSSFWHHRPEVKDSLEEARRQ
jgi:hypothetical protein